MKVRDPTTAVWFATSFMLVGPYFALKPAPLILRYMALLPTRLGGSWWAEEDGRGRDHVVARDGGVCGSRVEGDACLLRALGWIQGPPSSSSVAAVGSSSSSSHGLAASANQTAPTTAVVVAV